MCRYKRTRPGSTNRSDCLRRAVSIAVGLKYNDVDLVSDDMWIFNTIAIIRREGFSIFVKHYTNEFNKTGMNSYQIAKDHPVGVFLVNSQKHIAAIIDGVLYDAFDSRSYPVISTWELKR